MQNLLTVRSPVGGTSILYGKPSLNQEFSNTAKY